MNNQPPPPPDHPNLRNLLNREVQQFRQPIQEIPVAIPVLDNPPEPENLHEDPLPEPEEDIIEENHLPDTANLPFAMNQQQMQQQLAAANPVSLQPFHGKEHENPSSHVQKFKIYARIRGIHDDLELIKTHFGQFL